MGGLGGQKCKSLENLPNGWTDWHQIWYTSADSSRNGHRLKKTISPSIPKGGLGGQKSGKSTKRLDRLAPNLVHVCGFISEWTLAENKQSLETRGSFWGLGGENVIKSLRNAMICREKIKINYIKMKCTNRHNYAATIPGEAG